MDKHLRPSIAEMVGTFIIVFIGAAAVCTDAVSAHRPGLVGIALAQGIAWAVAMYATQNLSGGQLNPATTITLWVYKRIDTDRMIFFIIAQLIGALVAGGAVAMIFSGSVAPFDAELGTPHIKNVQGVGATSQFTAIGIEAVLTFILIFVYFAAITDHRAPRLGAAAVGLIVAAGIIVCEPLIGASMNPARVFGTAVWEARLRGSMEFMTRDHFVYWIGPILGGLLAGGLYTNLFLPAPPAKKEPEAVGGKSRSGLTGKPPM
jgi:MIP family channel proteins